MLRRSANLYLFLVLFCASFLSFSQDDDGMTLLKDADNKQIKFENHYFEALKYKAIGNYTRAITELEKCQQLFSNDKSIVFELSKNYFYLKKYNEAELYITSALKTDSENYWFLEHAKKLYLKQYNYSKAIEVQEKMVAQNPKKTEDLVLMYLRTRKYDKAKKLISKLESNHQSSSKLTRYKELIAVREKTTAISEKVVVNIKNKTLEELKKVFENDQQYKVLKGILEQELINENFSNLLTYSNKGLELFPAQPTVYLMNGKSLIHIKKYNEAIDVLNNGIDFVVDDLNLEVDFYEQFIICYKALNQEKEAKKYLDKVNRLKNNINK